MRRPLRSLPPLLLLVALLVACGDDSGLTEVGSDQGAGGATTTLAAGGATTTEGPFRVADAITVVGENLPSADAGDGAAIGMAAPEVTGPSFDGSPLTFANGAPRVVVFLAHWCGHCQAELDELGAWLAAGNTLPPGVAIQSISTREAPDAANYPPEAWLAAAGWEHPVMVDDSAETLAQAFGLRGTPMWGGDRRRGDRRGPGLGDPGTRDDRRLDEHRPVGVSGGSDHRPRTSADKRRFSSGGRTGFIILKGRGGRAVDTALVWGTGYSLITKQYALAGGRPYTPTLLLTTVGARTGRRRRAVLPYFRVGDDLVVRGSNGGGPTDPGWVHNVRANPAAWVRVRCRTRPALAHVATGAEREQLYDTLCRMSDMTRVYQDMCAPRELPLVVLRER